MMMNWLTCICYLGMPVMVASADIAILAQVGTDLPAWVTGFLGPLGGVAFAIWSGYYLISVILPRTEDRHQKERDMQEARHATERETAEARFEREWQRQEQRHEAERAAWLKRAEEKDTAFLKELAEQRMQKHEFNNKYQESLLKLTEAVNAVVQEAKINRNVATEAAKMVQTASNVIKNAATAQNSGIS